MLKEGTKAPDFTAQDQNEKTHSLKDYEGKWVLLYFYPRDDTPGCVKEACAIRDTWAEFKKAGITVLGMSGDTTASHKKFADKYELPFTLLADPERKIMKKYKAIGTRKMFGREYQGIIRSSYLINPKGNIAKAYPKVKPDMHADQILEDIKTIQA